MPCTEMAEIQSKIGTAPRENYVHEKNGNPNVSILDNTNASSEKVLGK